MTTPDTAVRLCACGCGEPVSSKGARWKRGHFHYGEGGWPGESPRLPGPDDLDLIDLDGIAAEAAQHGARMTYVSGQPPPGAGDDQGADDSGHDPPPAPLRRDTRARPSSSSGTPRVTATVRRDINAKISMPLEVLARLWEVRDPICGGRAVEQRPAIAEVFTEFVCQSADMVDFFTGPGGQYMLIFKGAAAVWPIVEIALAHHVTHSVGEPPGKGKSGPAPVPDDLSRYVA